MNAGRRSPSDRNSARRMLGGQDHLGIWHLGTPTAVAEQRRQRRGRPRTPSPGGALLRRPAATSNVASPPPPTPARSGFPKWRKWRPDSIAQSATAAELADRHYRLGAVPAATYGRAHTGSMCRDRPDTPSRGSGCGGNSRTDPVSTFLQPAMIERILEFSLRQRTVVLLATALLLGIGIWSARAPHSTLSPTSPSPRCRSTRSRALAPEEAEMLGDACWSREFAGLPGVGVTSCRWTSSARRR